MPRARVLTRRELNRALLARQGLLVRRRSPALAAVERVVGLQAQVPRDPYVGLWSRVEGFHASALSEAIASGRAVRISLMRGTLHLVAARDAVELYPVLSGVMHRGLRAQPAFRAAFDGVDLAEVLEHFEALLRAGPKTRSEIAVAAAERWPDRDAASLSAAMAFLPLAQVPPRGLWRASGPSAFGLLEDHLRVPVPRERDRPPDALVLRYLAAFGPSTIADAASWSGLRDLGPVFERLGPRLRILRDDTGRQLFDVPRAPLPDGDVEAPVRFLPEFDNAVLAHRDRSRIVPDGVPQWGGAGWGPVLVDGWLGGRWRLTGRRAEAAMRVETVRRLAAAERDAIAEAASALASFLAPEARISLAVTRVR
jgi:hypothetical protein